MAQHQVEVATDAELERVAGADLLICRGDGIDDAGLERLRSRPILALWLRACPNVTGESFGVLETWPLESLTIWNTALGHPDAFRHVASSRVRSVEIVSCELRADDLRDLARSRRLEELVLRDVAGLGPGALAPLSSVPTLRRVAIERCDGVPETDLSTLREAIPAAEVTYSRS